MGFLSPAEPRPFNALQDPFQHAGYFPRNPAIAEFLLPVPRRTSSHGKFSAGAGFFRPMST